MISNFENEITRKSMEAACAENGQRAWEINCREMRIQISPTKMNDYQIMQEISGVYVCISHPLKCPANLVGAFA